MSFSAAAVAPVGLPEQLTLQGAVQTLSRLKPLLAQQVGSVVVLDAARLQVFDTSAVAVLLELRNDLLVEQRVLKVRDMPERLRALVTLYGVAELLPV